MHQLLPDTYQTLTSWRCGSLKEYDDILHASDVENYVKADAF